MRTWRVLNVMTTDVVAVREDASYREIVDLLAQREISAVPVVDADWRVVGVVSQADLLHKVEFMGEAQERRIFAGRRRRSAQAKAHGRLARELMSAPAITVVPGTTLTVAAKLMDDEQVKRLPVVDDLGRLCGIVTRGDLLRVYLRPDPEIARDVGYGVLEQMLLLERGRVSVKVRDGVVTLAGRADRCSTARLAVKLTQAVPGVVEVVDRLGFDFDDRKLAEAGHFRPGPFGMP